MKIELLKSKWNYSMTNWGYTSRRIAMRPTRSDASSLFIPKCLSNSFAILLLILTSRLSIIPFWRSLKNSTKLGSLRTEAKELELLLEFSLLSSLKSQTLLKGWAKCNWTWFYFWIVDIFSNVCGNIKINKIIQKTKRIFFSKKYFVY